jgi:hypothetical protein
VPKYHPTPGEVAERVARVVLRRLNPDATPRAADVRLLADALKFYHRELQARHRFIKANKAAPQEIALPPRRV